ncbi:uncharacterized protein RAG0_04261 [Rhynchosporium agropyri]|uniref:Uncharacterized protein n=1 Tax=Rhynchosporium agropyri TaxID=914238 RepID=A0A1E1KBW9_9HELO|nr:uncharacterized protein RAG0_04261 [Rhynchosporium agropyri]
MKWGEEFSYDWVHRCFAQTILAALSRKVLIHVAIRLKFTSANKAASFFVYQ